MYPLIKIVKPGEHTGSAASNLPPTTTEVDVSGLVHKQKVQCRRIRKLEIVQYWFRQNMLTPGSWNKSTVVTMHLHFLTLLTKTEVLLPHFCCVESEVCLEKVFYWCCLFLALSSLTFYFERSASPVYIFILSFRHYNIFPTSLGVRLKMISLPAQVTVLAENDVSGPEACKYITCVVRPSVITSYRLV